MRQPTEYIDKVLRYIKSWPMNTIKEKKNDNENYDKFVEAVKDIIDLEIEAALGFSLVFNDNSYSKLIKSPYPIQWKSLEGMTPKPLFK